MGTWSSYMVILDRVIIIVVLDVRVIRVPGNADDDTQKRRV